MAAVPASRRECAHCAQPLTGSFPYSAHVCSACGFPQPLGAEETYFSALGLPVRLRLEPELVERRYYEASRALHPDRFSQAGAAARRNSMERATFLNSAYATLRDRTLLRTYFLKWAGATTAAQAAPPAELAHEWFELQDALAEDPAGAADRIGVFETRLQRLRAEREQLLTEVEARLDAALESLQHAEVPPPLAHAALAALPERDALLARLSEAASQESYFASLTRDLGRMKKRLSFR